MYGSKAVLKDLSDSQIKKFAGSTIYDRGYGYYKDDKKVSGRII